jgi:hypothetical protein
MLQSILSIVSTVLGITMDIALDTTAGYFKLLKRASGNLVFLSAFMLVGFYLAIKMENSIILTLLTITAGIIIAAYLTIGIPMIFLVMLANKKVPIINKILTGIVTICLGISFLALFISRTDAATRNPTLLISLIIGAVIFIVSSAVTGRGLNSEAINKSSKIATIVSAILLIIPMGLKLSANAMFARGQLRSQQALSEALKQNLVNLNSDCSLRCFDVTNGSPLCWYQEDEAGKYIIFDAPGADQSTGESFKVLDQKIAKTIITQCKVAKSKREKEEAKAAKQAALTATPAPSIAITPIPTPITTPIPISTPEPQIIKEVTALITPTIQPTPIPKEVVRIPKDTEIPCRLTNPISTRKPNERWSLSCTPAEDIFYQLGYAPQKIDLIANILDIVGPSPRQRGSITLELTRIVINDKWESFSTYPTALTNNESTTRRRGGKIIGGALGGAIIGAILDGKSGAVRGSAIGGGVGAIGAATTNNPHLELPTGLLIKFRSNQEYSYEIN